MNESGMKKLSLSLIASRRHTLPRARPITIPCYHITSLAAVFLAVDGLPPTASRVECRRPSPEHRVLSRPASHHPLESPAVASPPNFPIPGPNGLPPLPNGLPFPPPGGLPFPPPIAGAAPGAPGSQGPPKFPPGHHFPPPGVGAPPAGVPPPFQIPPGMPQLPGFGGFAAPGMEKR